MQKRKLKARRLPRRRHKRIYKRKPQPMNEMIVRLVRFNSEKDYTSGLIYVDGKFVCFSIEDELRTKKVWGETCIPNGEYEISLRHAGKFHERYKVKFPEMHKGILCIHNAPDWKLITPEMEFQYILIHIGNDDDDTAGCLLTGSVAYMDKNRVDRSTDAYKKLYPQIADHLEKGGTVKLVVETIETAA